MRRADGDSDHYLVKGKIKGKINKVTHRKGIIIDKYDTAELNDNYTSEIPESDVGKNQKDRNG